MRFACPCCRLLTLSEQPPGTFAICAVCCWEDDPVQFENVSLRGGANRVSLCEARQNFQRIGASSEECLGFVRPADESEMPVDDSGL
ncbi:MAG TPA: CPCC family cysteine-rich protein [Phycisphaerae bacterium]|nr:CPCC family cysteine-rich protein [Phycisphaerae bacterium]